MDTFSRYPVDDPDVDDEQADVEATTHIHATLFQAQRDHNTDDRILALLEDPISCISKQKRIRTLNTNSFSPQPSMASHPTIADSTASWDPSSPFVTTYGLPTRCSCMSRVAVPTRLRKRSTASCNRPIKAKTILYAGPDRWSTGYPSQTIFTLWSTAAQRAQNAFPPTPLSLSWSNRRRPARSICAASNLFQLAGHHFLVYTDRFSGWPTVSTCGRTATSARVISLLKESMS